MANIDRVCLTDTEVAFIIERLVIQEYQLNEWEQGFLASVRRIQSKGEKLTGPQMKVLFRIWEKINF